MQVHHQPPFSPYASFLYNASHHNKTRALFMPVLYCNPSQALKHNNNNSQSTHLPKMQHHPTASSAPGKVLLAGGYLVLDRHHTGLVFGLDARIHVVVQETEVSRSSPSTPSQRVVVVKSPQFEGAVWRYLVGVDKRTDDGGVEVVDG